LYPDAKLTVTEAFVAIMQLSLKHTFSNSAVEDLTKVLSFMLPENHQFAHSRHLFKKFFSEIEIYYFITIVEDAGNPCLQKLIAVAAVKLNSKSPTENTL